MNKLSTGKLALFLTGLEQRIVDNAQYFKTIKAVFKSGTRAFNASIALQGEKLIMNYNGNKEVLEIAWLSARLSKIAQEYDSVSITYEERGTVLIIEADNKNVKMMTKESDIKDIPKGHNETSHIGNRDYVIKVGQADQLLKEIGIMGDNGKVKNDMVRKYNQIDHFVELISDMIKGLTADNKSITVLDCACGKSYLSFALNYYIKEVLKRPCHFIGLDYSKIVVEASRKMAANLGYNNMEFKVTDIKNYSSSIPIDMVISLHACDTATDEAIAMAVNNNVKSMVVVPCCHKEFLSQYSFEPFSQIMKHGILKARLADTLTDGMRALLLEALGYKVSVVEYISPLETPKNIMIRAEKTKGLSKASLENYRELKKMLNVEPTLEKLIYKQD